MKIRRRLVIVGAALGLAGAAWFGWRWYTTPPLPNIPLEGASEEKVEKVTKAVESVRHNRRSGKAWGELGLTLLANGFQEEAATCFVNAERFDPNDPRWPYHQGIIALVTGRPEAFDKLRAALAAARTTADRRRVLFSLARALAEEGQLDEAERRAKELRAIAGECPEVDFCFGIIAVGRGDRASARLHLSQLTQHPSARKKACSLLAGLTEDAQQSQQYQQQASRLPQDQQWPDSFESALEQYRPAPKPRLALYRELENTGRHEEALAYLQDLVRQSPDEESCLTLGFALFSTNRFEEATQVYRQAIGLNSRNPKSHLFLGASLLQLGESRLRASDGKEKAMALFRETVAAEDKAIALQSDIADAHLARGRALKYLGRTDEAIASFRQAVLVGTEYAEMHQALGEALAEAGQIREGLEHLEDAVKLAKPGDKRPQEALDKWKAKAKSPTPPK
jgi:tetratricopeptide (TPR) repeat protein